MLRNKVKCFINMDHQFLIVIGAVMIMYIQHYKVFLWNIFLFIFLIFLSFILRQTLVGFHKQSLKLKTPYLVFFIFLYLSAKIFSFNEDEIFILLLITANSFADKFNKSYFYIFLNILIIISLFFWTLWLMSYLLNNHTDFIFLQKFFFFIIIFFMVGYLLSFTNSLDNNFNTRFIKALAFALLYTVIIKYKYLIDPIQDNYYSLINLVILLLATYIIIEKNKITISD